MNEGYDEQLGEVNLEGFRRKIKVGFYSIVGITVVAIIIIINEAFSYYRGDTVSMINLGIYGFIALFMAMTSFLIYFIYKVLK